MAYKEVFLRADAPDGGDGLSDATAFNTQAAAVAACSATENVLRIRRGLIYQNIAGTSALLNFAVRPAGYIKVRSYGDELMPPTLYGGLRMLPGDTGWVYVGDGLWKKAISDNSAAADAKNLRIFTGSELTGPAVNNSLGTGYVIGKPIARYAIDKGSTEAQVLAEIGTRGSTAPRLWMYTSGASGGNGILYIYTGTALLDPPTYYDGITLVGANGLYSGANKLGATYGVLLYACDRVVVTEIDAIYAAASHRATSNGPSVDCGFVDCNAIAFGASGLAFSGASSTYRITRAFGRRCSIDASAHLDEDWNYRTKDTFDWINATQDGVAIGPYTEGCVLDSCVSKDAAHGTFFVGSQQSATYGYDDNALIVDCEASTPNRLYGSLAGCSGLGAGNKATFVRFYGHDANYALSRSGNGTCTFESSLFQNFTKPMDAYTAITWPSMANTVPAITVFVATAWGHIEPGCLTFNNCTIMQSYGFTFNIAESGTTGEIPAGAIALNRTLVVDTRNLNNPAARTYGYGSDLSGITVSTSGNTVPAGVMVAANSFYWTGVAGQARVQTDPSTSYTFASWSGLSGTLNESDPMVDANGFIASALSPLIGAGGHPGYGRDRSGMMFNNPRSIGCYEYNDGDSTGP